MIKIKIIGSISRALGFSPARQVTDKVIRGLEKELSSVRQSNNVYFAIAPGTAVSKEDNCTRELKMVSLSAVLKKATNMLDLAKREGASPHKTEALGAVISDSKDFKKAIPATAKLLDVEIAGDIKKYNDPLARAMDDYHD
ncbi:hypothetical protein [Pseudomonas sp. 65/3-MNA-CIBAN-0223]|uniref:hypothetical protein n=1 Tax=Pseudomonas sp. 65/3-MNA-CIBAN-0223 TaxID=3140476 RepID=UPI003326BB7E